MSTRHAATLSATLALGAGLALGLGCSLESRKLLCTADEDCRDGTVCERVSGLCKPASSPPSNARSGAAGAFDCPLIAGAATQMTRPGLATMVVRRPSTIPGCGAPIAPEGAPIGDAVPVSCGFVRRTEAVRGPDGTREVEIIELELRQFSGDPSEADGRAVISMRASRAGVGSFTLPSDASARLYERCTVARGDSDERLRFVATRGSLEITAIEDGRISGRFDLEIADTQSGRGSGERCAPVSDCAEGCAAFELASADCQAGACQADRFLDPSGATGFCSGSCEAHADCGEPDGRNYCYFVPLAPRGGGAPRLPQFGTCIRLCAPGGPSDQCAAGSSCRDGEDFTDFYGGPGVPRCLDDCLPSASRPSDAVCTERPKTTGGAPDSGRPPPPDAGERPDSGRPPQDAGPPPDSGRPPLDAGVEPDSGPVDTGVEASPLATVCDAQRPCAAGWFCGAARGASTTGFCTRMCTPSADDCGSGYSGPGRAVCGAGVRRLDTGTRVGPVCSVACGTDLGGDGASCPTGLSCGDLINNQTRMPPGDGRPDYCVE